MSSDYVTISEEFNYIAMNLINYRAEIVLYYDVQRVTTMLAVLQTMPDDFIIQEKHLLSILLPPLLRLRYVAHCVAKVLQR